MNAGFIFNFENLKFYQKNYLYQGCHKVRKNQEFFFYRQKSEKKRVLEKSQEIKKIFEKISDFVCLNLQNSLFSKAFKW